MPLTQTWDKVFPESTKVEHHKVTFKNRGESVELSGLKMMQEGIPVRLETAGTSEMLLFSSDEPQTQRAARNNEKK